MPLYEYECPTDGVFELVRKFSDPPLAACPKCGGPVEKLASAPAIQFKGTGWYVTDYARKSTGERAKDKGAPSESGKDQASGSKEAGSGGTASSTSSAAASSAGSSEKSSTGADKKSSDKKK